MRAIYYPFEQHKVGDVISVTGDSLHHLSVVRVREQDELMLLNGKGQRLKGLIESVSKKNIDIKITSEETLEPQHQLSLAIALPKKEAFEDILKMATELGVRTIYPLTSEYSQYEYGKSERVDRILESALVQSNNAFFPVIEAQQTLSDFLKAHSHPLAFFNSKKAEKDVGAVTTSMTILIGPEGGFSPSEIDSILAYPKTLEIHLPTPILRAPTATAAAVGYLLSKTH